MKKIESLVLLASVAMASAACPALAQRTRGQDGAGQPPRRPATSRPAQPEGRNQQAATAPREGGEQAASAPQQRQRGRQQTGGGESEAALSFIVQVGEGWPILHRPQDHGPRAIQAGWTCPMVQVSLDGSAQAAQGEQAGSGWEHARFEYKLSGGKTGSVLHSRLTPAVLFESSAAQVALRQPDVSQARYTTIRGAESYKPSVASVKYVAWAEAKGPVVKAVKDLAAPASPAMSEPWLIVWYGSGTPLRGYRTNAHDWNGGFPGPPNINPRPFDMPLLIRLEHKPTSIAFDETDGLKLTFAGAAGKFAVMPLFGGKLFPPDQTEKWSSELPADALAQAKLWSAVLRDIPVTVAETHKSDIAGDMLTIAQEFTWSSFTDDWNTPAVKAAPIPPMLGVALRGGAKVTFHAGGKTVEPADLNLMDTFGRMLAVKGVDAYEYRLAGLGTYVLQDPKPAVGKAPAKYRDRLSEHVLQMVQAGQLAPLAYNYAGVGSHINSMVYWGNSAELARAAVAAYPHLDEDLQKQLLQYLAEEFKTNPPLKAPSYGKGASRTAYEIPAERGSRTNLAESLRTHVMVADILPLVDCAAIAGQLPVAADELRNLGGKQAQALLARQEWAILGPRRASQPGDNYKWHELQGSGMYNVWLSGMIGWARLAQREGWGEDLDTAWYLAGKLALARAGQGLYVDELYRMGHLDGEAANDARCIVDIGQSSVVLTIGNLALAMPQAQEFQHYYGMSWPVGRLLGDFAPAEAKRVLGYMDSNMSTYYIPESIKLGGSEHRTTPLEFYDSLVLAQCWANGRTGDAFARYIDVTRFKGDLYYIQNLSALLDSYGEMTSPLTRRLLFAIVLKTCQPRIPAA